MKIKIFITMVLALAVMFTACKKDDKPVPQYGVIFNPTTPSQESLPGQIISFKFKVISPEPVTSLAIRFKLPNATDFVALPEYPDVTQNVAAYVAQYRSFEYALPPNTVAGTSYVQIKFIAKTAATTYEREYSVKMMSTGLQRIRLYAPLASDTYRFTTIDLARSVSAPVSADLTAQDMLATTTKYIYALSGQQLDYINGWTAANGTRFKLATAANYNASPSTYGILYNAIAAANELTTVGTNLGTTPLALNQYYLCKVVRPSGTSYVAINIKKSPLMQLATAGSRAAVILSNEYLEIEIKK